MKTLFKKIIESCLALSIILFSLGAQARSEKNGFCDFLNKPVTVSVSQYLDFPIVSSHEHSMSDALPTYVHQKIQTNLIKEAVSNGFSIEIIGSPPDILQCRLYGPAIFEEIMVKYDKKLDKQENFRRPSYYYRVGNDKTLVIFVMPGEDYVKQFAALVGCKRSRPPSCHASLRWHDNSGGVNAYEQ